MIEVLNCVICEGEILRLKQAMVAPFLARRIWDRSPFPVELVECQSCGFLFYNPRLDAVEEARLYTNYRSEEYQRMRHASEPWYTARFNAELASAGSYEVRRRTLAAILSKHAGARNIKTVLDYGGDRGDLVRGLIDGAEAFVYDISGIAPAEGVTATTDPAACRPDLIVNSNVLEHVGFPRQLLRDIRKAAPAGCLVFLEVPCEAPFGAARLLRRVAQLGVVALMRPALARSLVRPSSLYMMHEHINYFTEKTLAVLMRSCDCAVVATGRHPVEARGATGDMVWCLGTAGSSD